MPVLHYRNVPFAREVLFRLIDDPSDAFCRLPGFRGGCRGGRARYAGCSVLRAHPAERRRTGSAKSKSRLVASGVPFGLSRYLRIETGKSSPSGGHQYDNTADNDNGPNDWRVWDMMAGGLTSLYRPEVDNFVAGLESDGSPDQNDYPYGDQYPSAYCFIHFRFPPAGAVFAHPELLSQPHLSVN